VSTAELILRIIGVTLLSMLTVILLRARRRDLKVLAAAALSASVCAFLLTSMPHAQAFFGLLIYPLTALCSTHPVWFWLFSMALFSGARTLSRLHLACLCAMALTGVFYQSMFPVAPGYPQAGVHALGVAFATASLFFACLAPVSVFAGRSDDLDARRRRIRRWFVPGAAAYLAIIVVTQAIVLFRGEPTPKPMVLLNIAVIDVVAVVALSTFLKVRVVNWLDVLETRAESALSQLEQSVLTRLDRRFVPERLYAQPSVTIAELAGLLGTQEHVLRRVINCGLGFRNFSDFLHAHRLKEAAQRLRDPHLRRVPVLTIALDVGYASIGPFNRAFRERFGVTPTEYRRAPDLGEFPAVPASPPG
jgi:AraC-like DNA-binding protein